MARKTESSNIRVSTSSVLSIFFGKFFKAIGVVVGIGLIVYFAFVLTILRVVPTTSGAGFVPVKNLTYEGGLIPAGSEILVARSAPVGTEWTDRLKQGFTPMNDGAVVRVLAGPYGKLAWTEPGIVSVDGTAQEAPMPPTSDNENPLKERSKFLEGEYLVECVSGACLSEASFIVPDTHVVGTLISSTEYVKNK